MTEPKKIRKFRCKDMETLCAISHELMIRRVTYEIRMVKGFTAEIVTRDELTETARKEIASEAKKAMVK